MLRIHMSGSVGAAKNYYSAGLGVGDYYTGEELAGVWHGKAAEMLGLSGEVREREFHALCDNLRPDNGNQLTPRMATNRRVGYDMVFSAPKSVSILQGVISDSRIISAFQKSVREIMQIIEDDAHVRVRKNGENRDRKTGNLVWGEFTHFTSRPVDDISAPDPNLHIHAYCFNVSYDEIEERFKAGEFFRIKRDAPYYEALFHSKLAGELQQLGYQIENKPFGFEVAGVGEENIKRFSRRANEIEALAEELGIADNAKAKDSLAAKTRKLKQANLTKSQIKRDWLTRLDRDSLTYQKPANLHSVVTAKQAIDYALAKHFERKSVVSYRRLIADAIQFSVGDCKSAEIEDEITQRQNLIITPDGVTTTEILAEERQVLELLRETRGIFAPLNADYLSSSKDADQKEALEGLLNNGDMVFVVHGKAGTGKTTLLREAVAAIPKQVYTFAPTSNAAHKVLKQEGFKNSNTVQQLLINPKLQQQMQDAVMWIDEAGLLSVGEVNKLLEIAKSQNARLVFSGDVFQHHSVNRGDGLRLVVDSKLVEVKQTRNIYRQKSQQYKQAVQAISEGRITDGISTLNKMGAIIECPDIAQRCKLIAGEYTSNSLVISPTHAEADLVTEAIREKLKQDGKLQNEIAAITHKPRNLTKAERAQSLFLNVGDIVKFHQNAKGFKKGDIFKIEHISKNGRVWLDAGNKLHQLDPATAKHYQIYKEENLPLAIGDKIRLTKNITIGKTKLYNGSVHEVVGFENGCPITENGLRITAGGYTHGYVSTSHSSQGKTTDKVVITQTSLSAAASSLEQFYVSLSRGRYEVKIFTDNQAELLENIKFSAQRMLAIELEEKEAKRRRVNRGSEEKQRSHTDLAQFRRVI